MSQRRMATGRFLKAAATVVAGLAAAACTTATVPFEAQQAGSVAVSQESGLIYVADQDNGGVMIVDPAAGRHQAPKFTATGEHPERLVLRDGQLFVANRYSRTVTQLDAKTLTVVRQISTGAEPMGLRLTKDGKTLVVANATSGSVQAFQTSDGARQWETKLGDEVHALAILPDGRIYAPGYKSGQLHVLDGSGAVLKTVPFDQPVDAGANYDRRANIVQDALVADDGHVYIPHSQTQRAPLAPVTTGYYAVGPAPAVSPGITTLDDAADTVFVDKKGSLGVADPGESAGFPPTMFSPTESFSGPTVAALDGSGEYLYVVNHWSNNVAVVSTRRHASGSGNSFSLSLGDQGVSQLVQVGRGPNGIALSVDQHEAYVYNSFDHTITVLGAAPDGGIMALRELNGAGENKELLPQTLTDLQQRGRILFNDASDDRLTLTAAGGVACASCHPDGREDGNNWQFAEGTRNTPLLAGKHLKQTKPYHWDGQFDEFSAFQHVLQKRMGGSGIEADEFNAILEYLDNEHGPDNPDAPAPGEALPTQAAAGKALFEGRAACAACHTGAILTDNKFYDVGTGLTGIPLELDGTSVNDPSLRKPVLANTPSLIGLFATGPYLHDGSKATIEARIRDNPGDKHGHTSDLTDGEIASLAAYLKTL